MSALELIGLAIVTAVGGLVLFTAFSSAMTYRRVPAEGSFMMLPEAEIHYEDSGSGIPVVGVHGLMSQLRCFAFGFSSQLADTYRCLVVDRPGWGYSRIRTLRRPGIIAQAQIMARFIDELGLDRPVIVGHSVGGAVALAMAIYHPEKIRGVALVSPMSQPMDAVPEPFAGMVAPSALVPLISWTLATPISLLMNRALVAKVFMPERAPEAYDIMGGGRLATLPSSYSSTMFELSVIRDEVGTLAAAYPKISVPVTIIYGANDAILDAQVHGVRTAAEIPGARLTLMEGGHMLPVTKASQLEQWLRREIALMCEVS